MMLDWFISILGVALSCYMVIWIGVEEFLYKRNVGFLGKFLFWSLLIQIELLKFMGKLDF